MLVSFSSLRFLACRLASGRVCPKQVVQNLDIVGHTARGHPSPLSCAGAASEPD